MKKYRIELDINGGADVEKLINSLKNVNTELEEIDENQEKVKESAEKSTASNKKSAEESVSGFRKLKSALLSAVGGFKALAVAVAATGLGLLIGAFMALKKAINSSEEGQNKFNKIMNALGVITGNIIDLLAKFGNGIIDAFENPKQAIQDFKKLIIENVQNRIDAVIKLFGFLGSAVKKVFSGDFAGAMDDAKAAGIALIDVTTGVENTFGKVADVIKKVADESKKEIAISNRLSDLQARNDKLTRQQLVARAKLESEIADLKLKAEQADQFSLEEREAALRRALELNETIFAREEEIAANALKIQRERNKMSGSTKEDLMQEAQLEANLILLQKQRADASIEFTTKILGFSNQRIAQAEKERQAMIAEADEEINAIQFKDDADAGYWDAKSKRLFKSQKEAEKFHEDELQREKDVLAAKKAALSAGLQFSSQILNTLAAEEDASTKKGFEKSKKLRIAATTLTTISSAMAAYNSMLSIPIVGIPLGIAAAAASVAMGLKQIQAIKQTTFDGGGQATSPSAAAASVTASPSSSLINPLSNDAANAAIESAPTRAYVVSSDVSTGAALDRSATSTANF